MEELLETQIDKATDPSRTSDGVDYVAAVCDKVNRDFDGPQVCLRYTVEKVKCRQENVAMLGLSLIEACVKNCGKRLHQEIGKYRFLNELIKLISSKYDGDLTPEPVKRKIVELLYNWTKGLPNESKVAEAYKMLKHQGVVTKDPDDPYSPGQSAPRQDPIFGDDQDKAKLLARLLKSKHPEDLQAANKLIKSMVRQDEIKTERLAKRIQELETSCNNIKLLTEMMNNCTPSSPPQDRDLMKELYDACDKMRPQLFKLASSATEDGDDGLGDILKVNDDLSKVMEEYRKRFGTSDVATSSVAIPVSSPAPGGEAASSLIDLGMSQPSNARPGQDSNTASFVLENELKALGIHDATGARASSSQQAAMPVANGANMWMNQGMPQRQGVPQGFQNSFSERAHIGAVRPMGHYPSPSAVPSYQSPMAGYNPRVNLGPAQPGTFPSPYGPGMGRVLNMQRTGPITMGSSSAAMTTSGIMARGNVSASSNKKAPTSSLDLLAQEVLLTQKQQKDKPPAAQLQQPPAAQLQPPAAQLQPPAAQLQPPAAQLQPPTAQLQPPVAQLQPPVAKVEGPPKEVEEGCLLSLGPDDVIGAVAVPSSVASPAVAPLQPPKPTDILPLDDVFVPLDSILPGSQSAVTILDKSGVRTVFHGAKTTAAMSRTDVSIIVVSTMNSLPSALKLFVFQVAVPKTMRVKLQLPSATSLPAYNPVLPPSAITQVMLIANPNKEKTRLKYRISYEVDGLTVVETGEAENLPTQ